MARRLLLAALLAVVVAMHGCSARPAFAPRKLVPDVTSTAASVLPIGALNMTKSDDNNDDMMCIAAQNVTAPGTYLIANGTQPLLQPCNATSPLQNWTVVPANVTNYSALSTADEMCLDVPNGAAANGVLVQLWSCDYNNTNQFWSVQDGALQFYNSTFCLNAQNGTATSFANNTALQLWSCADGGNNNLINVPALVSSLLGGDDSGDDDSGLLDGTPSSSTGYTPPYKSAGGKYNLTSVFNPSRKRMLAWGYENSAAIRMAAGNKIGSYHHWEMNEIEGMPAKVQYVPTYWGVAKTAAWSEAKAQLSGTVPGAVMGFNEPDVPSQANMGPIAAAQLFKTQISDIFGARGSNVISPSIAYNVNGWLTPFMNECDRLGCDVDAIGMHMYLSLARDGGGSVDRLVSIIKQRIESTSQKFGGRKIVLGELGLTQAGGGSDADMMEFMQKSAAYLDNSPYVLAWALSAAFRQGAAWDGYMNSNLAFFNSDGSLSALGRNYMNTDY